ncbi:MAG: Holliday junction branch migration protein RuvA [Treponema sp.]|nr:Holliday junction branch migration protein RuvA [Treponema sp.]
MFNSIKGLISGKFSKQLYVECNGIEWDINMPNSNIDILPNVGSEVKVYTWLHHTENFMNLYGFVSMEERELFLNLLKVDGVGPKGALKIMSSVTSAQLLKILEDGDLGLLEKIPGVGKKTAGKMLLALKGKISISENEKTVRVAVETPYKDVIMSLISMGYDKSVVEQKVFQLIDSLKSDNSFIDKNQKEKEDFIFRQVIVELA